MEILQMVVFCVGTAAYAYALWKCESALMAELNQMTFRYATTRGHYLVRCAMAFGLGALVLGSVITWMAGEEWASWAFLAPFITIPVLFIVAYRGDVARSRD